MKPRDLVRFFALLLILSVVDLIFNVLWESETNLHHSAMMAFFATTIWAIREEKGEA